MDFLVVSSDFPPSIGGISTYTKELAAALSKKSKVTVLAPGALNTSSVDHACPFRIIRTPALPLVRYLAFMVYLPWIIHRYRIDLVLHSVWLTALVSHFWYCLLPVPFFVSVHGSEILDDKITWRRRVKGYLRPWRLAALKQAKGLFPVSRFSAELISSQGITKSRIHILSNGVDPQRFKTAANHPRKDRIKTLLTVARLDLHKGHDRVLEALAILKQDGLTPFYLIVGKGRQEFRLRKMVAALGLERQVEFAGVAPDSELPDIYARCDVFVMASREIQGRLDIVEGFGISFLEASASGLPVIAGDSGGVGDAVRNGETGLLVNPHQPQEIARAIKLLLIDTELAQRLGKQGRRWVESMMSWDCVAERLCRVVRRLI